MFGIKTCIQNRIGSILCEKSLMIPPLPPSLWDLDSGQNGHLHMNGIDLTKVADEYGTPLFCVNEKRARLNCRNLISCFSSQRLDFELFYSYKTNPVPGMLQIFHEEGVGAEVISDFELRLALHLGVSPEKIIFNGPGKRVESLALAIDKEVRLINIDSFLEIEKIKDIAEKSGKVVNVGLRVLTGLGWGGQFGFGIETGEALAAVKQIQAMSQLRLIGLHFHLGTSIHQLQTYVDALDVVFAFLDEARRLYGMEIAILDTGGGYAIPTVRPLTEHEKYLAHQHSVQIAPPKDTINPTPQEYAWTICGKIEQCCELYSMSLPTVIIEPGRLLSSSAQSLLLTVQDIKKGSGMKKIAILDGGSTNIAYPTMGEFREAFVVNRMNEPRAEIYTIVGSLCSPGDILYPAKYLPRMAVGDRLAIMDAGAYFVPNANNFSFARAAITTITETGHRLSRKRETFEYMIGNDLIKQSKGMEPGR